MATNKENLPCWAPQCMRPVRARNLCSNHYKKLRKLEIAGEEIAPEMGHAVGVPRKLVTGPFDCPTLVCSVCSEEKPLTHFRKVTAKLKTGPKAYYNPRCKPCQSRKDVCERMGITVEFYASILEKQHGRCALCKAPEARFVRGLALDHDHTCCPGRYGCGKCVRGLLCLGCNTLLGRIRDNPVVLQNAVAYLG